MSEVDDGKPHLRRIFDGKMYELSGEMIVGRLADCGIVLDQESGASRKHARFAVVEQDVFITDLGSLNGTLLNGKAIKDKAQLATGDILIFDVVEYEMLIPGQSAEPQIDPNMTVLINRDEIGNRHLIEPDTREADDEKFEAAVAVAVAAAEVEEDVEVEVEAEAESFARAASEANDEADARAASEAEAEADARAASEAKAEADARAASEAKAEADARAASEAKAEADALAASEARAEADARAASEAKAEADALAASEAEAESFARAASEANDEADARAASEAKAEADALAASEAKDEADARAVSEAKDEADARAASEDKAEADARAASEAEADARAASEAKAEADARAASEAKAEADARAAAEAKAEVDARAVSEARAEAKVETASEAKAEHVPGSWSDPTAGSNLGNTIFVDAIDFSNAQAVQAAQVDPASLTEPTLVVKTGENAGAMLQLVGEQTEWSIGSGADRNLALTESGVSTNHAAIVREGSKWKVVDQMSFNGTSVNDVSINIRFINSGDILHFGPVECLFVVPAGFVGATNSGTNSGNGSLFWKVAATIVILLILGGGYYAYSSGMFPSIGTPATTDAQ